MTRLFAALSGFALLVSASGCCHHLFGGGCGGCGPSPCGPCGANYGGAPAYSQAFAQPAYATASVANTGFVSASPSCNCSTGIGPTVAPY